MPNGCVEEGIKEEKPLMGSSEQLKRATISLSSSLSSVIDVLNKSHGQVSINNYVCVCSNILLIGSE